MTAIEILEAIESHNTRPCHERCSIGRNSRCPQVRSQWADYDERRLLEQAARTAEIRDRLASFYGSGR